MAEEPLKAKVCKQCPLLVLCCDIGCPYVVIGEHRGKRGKAAEKIGEGPEGIVVRANLDVPSVVRVPAIHALLREFRC